MQVRLLPLLSIDTICIPNYTCSGFQEKLHGIRLVRHHEELLNDRYHVAQCRWIDYSNIPRLRSKLRIRIMKERSDVGCVCSILVIQ
ncbi:MAG: hypothetical protein EZS28_002575 [Streblomastix strix]|uniref:Uncharacterized protein n=1 Tax=Streblomastix strix TaxID=222440 RepID=A0A5J4X3W1_9EUKA|nr:MAG: hypothetical protein EZS28_002575 [Streblomastix strix]